MPLTWHPISRAVAVGALVASALSAAGCTTDGAPSGSASPTGADSGTSAAVATRTMAPSTPATSAGPSARTSSTTTAVAAPTATGPAFAVLGGLDIPWSIAMLPDGAALVSVRNNAQVYWIPAPGKGGRPAIVGRVPGVVPDNEGGLLGLAVAKDFAADPVVYAYYTSATDNRVAAIPWREGSLGQPRVILDGIPHARNHNGGRIAFGPDGQLYVATGDASESALAQDLTSLGGKILRITPDGEPAPGNPFGGSPVWSYGHRNVQGLAWDAHGRMYASEFGTSIWDELNVIRPGGNYGWPEVEGRAGNADFVDPIAQWHTADASPSGIAIGPDAAIYLAALRGESVWRVPLRPDGAAGTPQRYLKGKYGRIRDIRFVGGRVWILTNNGSNDRLLSLPLADVGAK